MTTVSVPQVNPNDEVTAESVNAGPNAIAAVVNGQLDGANISTLPGSKLAAGSLPGTALAEEADPYLRLSESLGDFVASGLVWSSLTGLNASMTTGVAYIGGKRLKPAAIPSRVFTASRTTYVYIDSTGTPQYVEVALNGTPPVLPASHVLDYRINTNATEITGVDDLRSRVSVMPPRCEFLAYMTTTWNPSTASTTALLASGATKSYDTTNSVSSTGIFRAPVSGMYTFQVGVRETTSGTTSVLWFKNSAPYLSGNSKTGSAAQRISASVDVKLVAGETFAPYVEYANVSSFPGGLVNNCFSGALVRCD